MKTKKNTLEKQLNKAFETESGLFKVGRFIIQPIYWSEDENGNILYDTESMEEEFQSQIDELEELNETSEFSWE